MPPLTWRRKLGYEVSTAGDSRFSALVALMPDGRSIEMHYQCDIKGYAPGGTNWRLGKGKPPLDRSVPLYQKYYELWLEWSLIPKNLPLLQELLERAALQSALDGLSTISLCDRFATSEVNQARALVDVIKYHLRKRTLVYVPKQH